MPDYRAIISQLMERHDWQLLEQADFCQRLAARAQLPDEVTPATVTPATVDPEALTKIAVNLYCEVWYRACNSHGEERRRAYVELSHLLYDRAVHKYRDPDLAQEITQDAIVLVAEQLDNCQNPGAFMAFALLKLWNAATTYFRQRDRHRAQTIALPDEENGAFLKDVDLNQSLLPEGVAVDSEMTDVILVRISEIVHAAPRAEKQFKAVLLKFLAGYSDEEIATALDTDAANVHVLRSRGLKRLRSDAVLERLAAEFRA